MKVRASPRSSLAAELLSARRYLMAALGETTGERWSSRADPVYSPMGWHVGHIAAVQARWLLPGEEPRFGGFFDPAQTPKPQRTQLPSPQELKAWLEEVLARVCG